MMTTNEMLDAAAANLKTAEAAHAACLKWSPAAKRIVCIVSDAELDAKYAAVEAAQKAYTKACRKAGTR